VVIGEAKAKGAISIVNAVASGRGATLSVDLPTSAKVDVKEERGRWKVFQNGRQVESALASHTLRRTIMMLGRDPRAYSGSVETDSLAPAGVGLKTSSSASVAITLAVLSAFGSRYPDAGEVLGCSVSASLASGVSITGAMDDAASCLLGGVNFVDNSSGRILSRVSLKRSLPVLIRVPGEESRRADVPARYVRRFSEVADSIFKIGIEGNTWKAMTLNGLLFSSIYSYAPSAALRAIERGALGSGLSGTGPAVAAVFDDERDAGRLARDWADDGAEVIRTTTSDGGATVGT
jgi:shikimate kinase